VPRPAVGRPEALAAPDDNHHVAERLPVGMREVRRQPAVDGRPTDLPYAVRVADDAGGCTTSADSGTIDI
jgi:hypothetical protein